MKDFVRVFVVLITVVSVMFGVGSSSTVQAVEGLTTSLDTKTYLQGTAYPNLRSCYLTYGGGTWIEPVNDYFTEIGVLEIIEEKPVCRVEIHGSGCVLPVTLTVNGIARSASVSHDVPPFGVETIVFDIAPSHKVTIYTSVHLYEENRGFNLLWVKTYLSERVSVDVKPKSWPNPLNVKDKGILPVAILGSQGFDVSQIDPATVRLEGVAALRWALEDVGKVSDPLAGRDGFTDLGLKFEAQAVVAALGHVKDGDVQVLHLTGNLKPEFGGTAIVGEDTVIIIKK